MGNVVEKTCMKTILIFGCHKTKHDKAPSPRFLELAAFLVHIQLNPNIKRRLVNFLIIHMEYEIPPRRVAWDF